MGLVDSAANIRPADAVDFSEAGKLIDSFTPRRDDFL
jgi:hypothetical protein